MNDRSSTTQKLQTEFNLLQGQYNSLTELYEKQVADYNLLFIKQRDCDKLIQVFAEKCPNSYISIINKDLEVDFCSGQEFLKWNLDPRQFLGLNIEDILGDNAPLVKEHYLKTFEGLQISFELLINNINYYYKTVPLPADDGTIPRILVLVENITNRKQVEKAMLENHRINAIGEMTSAIAHDFNNTLQSIFGNLELLMLYPDIPDGIMKYVNALKTSASDAAARVNLLQRFGGKNKVESEYVPLCLNTLIEEVITQSRPLWKDEAEKNGLSINIKTEFGKIPDISGNAGELRSALFNVIKNSVEAMPEGGVITIETRKKGEKIFVSIKDTGIGMDDETKDKIFQPFYSTKGTDVGRGLGMSGVYSIVKEHEGSIGVKRSIKGKGTTLEILFPVSQKIKQKEKKVVIKINLPERESSLRVLWVDDEEAIRENVGEILELLGHNGDVAKSGKEALEYLENNHYDIVITDIGMPEMCGWELADIINKKFDRKMKVAIVSGWGLEIDETEKKEHNVLFVLEKPFNILQLKTLFKEVAAEVSA
jgi:signal transduction histidine kinase/CheY-like chemotaxis protein